MNKNRLPTLATRTKLSVVLFCLILLMLPACGVLKRNKTTPEAKAMVISVTSHYLTYVASGNQRLMDELILWQDFLGVGTSEVFTKEEFRRQFDSIQGRWNINEHPLLGLEVLDLEIKGSAAIVRLRKAKRADYPKIWVQLIWTGSAWMIVEDSLFGRDKLVVQLNRRWAENKTPEQTP